MKEAIVLDTNDIKEILAKHFNVTEESVIKSQYSFIVTLEKKGDRDENSTCTDQ